ncbi:MAG: hypothetical protein ABIG44_02230 [Planctomycetota bacterium]
MNATKMHGPLVGCLLLVLTVCSGCSSIYKITFQPGEAINTGGLGTHRSEMLDVNLICLSKSDAKDFPALVNGTMRSDEWFTARESDDPRLRSLDDCIYALCKGDSGTRVKPPLLDKASGGHNVTVEVEHPDPGPKEAAIVIFGRFHDGKGGLMKTQPVVLCPLPSARKEIFINVGPTSMVLLNGK